MAKFIVILSALISFSALADSNYQRKCARKYIVAAKGLVSIAQDFNNAEIGKAEYAAAVNATDAGIGVTRLICANENLQAAKCSNKTKAAYQKIRSQMMVGQVIKGNLNQVEVGYTDLIRLLRGAIGGFFESVLSGQDSNLCTIN